MKLMTRCHFPVKCDKCIIKRVDLRFTRSKRQRPQKETYLFLGARTCPANTCWTGVGPASWKMGQHQPNIGPRPRVCWVGASTKKAIPGSKAIPKAIPGSQLTKTS